jgi:hypothetical protein
MAIALKSSARITGVRPETLFAMRVAEGVFEDRKLGLMTITSCNDGKHSPGSKHYVGGAFDIRTRDIPQDQWQIVAGDIRERLGTEFDVVVEKDHFHIELDPKTPINA